jgi:HSP20 family protein
MLPVLRRNAWLSSSFDEPFTRFRQEIDTLFDRFFGTDGGSLTQAWSGVPVVMWEDDDHIFIEADVPGVAEKDIEVTVHNGMLFIRGERHPEPDRNYLYNSRSYGRFERVIALPATVNADEVKAKLAGGVLSIELSKTPESKPKKITVQTA